MSQFNVTYGYHNSPDEYTAVVFANSKAEAREIAQKELARDETAYIVAVTEQPSARAHRTMRKLIS
jgi:hypothetical protein